MQTADYFSNLALKGCYNSFNRAANSRHDKTLKLTAWVVLKSAGSLGKASGGCIKRQAIAKCFPSCSCMGRYDLMSKYVKVGNIMTETTKKEEKAAAVEELMALLAKGEASADKAGFMSISEAEEALEINDK